MKNPIIHPNNPHRVNRALHLKTNWPSLIIISPDTEWWSKKIDNLWLWVPKINKKEFVILYPNSVPWLVFQMISMTFREKKSQALVKKLPKKEWPTLKTFQDVWLKKLTVTDLWIQEKLLKSLESSLARMHIDFRLNNSKLPYFTLEEVKNKSWEMLISTLNNLSLIQVFLKLISLLSTSKSVIWTKL